jgi:hypothetical protein
MSAATPDPAPTGRFRRLLRAVVGPPGAQARKAVIVREMCWDAVWMVPLGVCNVGVDRLLRLLHVTGFGLVVCWTCQIAFLVGTIGAYAIYVVEDWRNPPDRGGRSR